MLEQRVHEGAALFVTLSYEQEPEGGLSLVDHQKFVRALRDGGHAVRYLVSGEYGELRGRAHLHYALFGLELPGDHGFNVRLYRTEDGRSAFECLCSTCARLRALWGKGFVSCKPLTVETAQYLAGYVMKKLDSSDDATRAGRAKEFVRMSLRPGLGTRAMGAVCAALCSALGAGATSAHRLPKALRHGRRILPLGRYLTGVLRQEMGVSKAEAKAVAEAESLVRQVGQVEKAGGYAAAVANLKCESAQRARNAESRVRVLSSRKVKL